MWRGRPHAPRRRSHDAAANLCCDTRLGRISSDGSGGITRPEVEGQIIALRRAYARAGYGADTVAYFEGHGTGTAVGDATELQALARARREAAVDREATGELAANGTDSSSAPLAVVSSVKAIIGHTMALQALVAWFDQSDHGTLRADPSAGSWL